MGSSNNFYQQALHENKLLQMKILELKHKAALYEVCLGSIASILKDLPLQQNISDTKHSQNAALHKIANVLTHIESVVKSNSESQSQISHSNINQVTPNSSVQLQPHSLHPTAQVSWPSNASSSKYSFSPRHPSMELHPNIIYPHLVPNFVPVETLPLFNKPLVAGIPQHSNAQEIPPHISTLSIQKCLKSLESQHHTVGAMTISPIKFTQNYPMEIRRSTSINPIAATSTMTKPIISWPPIRAPGTSSHFIDRKRTMAQESLLYEEITKKKAATGMDAAHAAAAAALDISTKQKHEDILKQQAFKLAAEQTLANLQQKSDISQKSDGSGGHPQLLPLPPIMLQAGNPFLLEKQAQHPHILNGGNVVVNMNNYNTIPNDNSSMRSSKMLLARRASVECCTGNNNSFAGTSATSSATSSSHSQSQSTANQSSNNFHTNTNQRILSKNESASVTNTNTNATATKQDEKHSDSEEDCTIIA